MREVDEAVRTDEVTNVVRKYGLPVGIVLVLALAAFGGYLFWQNSKEEALEGQSEALVQAFDKIDAGNLDDADAALALLDGDVSPAVLASGNMTRAAIALQQNRVADAVAFYEQVAANEGAPQPIRDAAVVRLVAANYDNMEPQAVIDRLQPLATPENAWFGSAGEMLAHAYLEQGKPDEAGPLMIQIAQNEDVPESIRARVRQLAGRYGFDAIEDVDSLLDDMRDETGGDAAAPAE